MDDVGMLAPSQAAAASQVRPVFSLAGSSLFIGVNPDHLAHSFVDTFRFPARQ